MAKNSTEKHIKEIEQNEKKFQKLKEAERCKCAHKHSGAATVKSSRDQNDRPNTFVCTQCKDKIHMDRIDPVELEKACQLVNDACNIIKMACTPSDKNDAELLRKIAKVQFRCRNLIVDAYKTAVKGNNKKKKNNDGPSIRYR